MADFGMHYLYDIIIKKDARKIYHFIIYNFKKNKQILKFENYNYNFIYQSKYIPISWECINIKKLAKFLLINY